MIYATPRAHQVANRVRTKLIKVRPRAAVWHDEFDYFQEAFSRMT